MGYQEKMDVHKFYVTEEIVLKDCKLLHKSEPHQIYIIKI